MFNIQLFIIKILLRNIRKYLYHKSKILVKLIVSLIAKPLDRKILNDFYFFLLIPSHLSIYSFYILTNNILLTLETQ